MAINSDRNVECRWVRQKSRLWAYIWLHCMLLTLRLARCYQHGAAGPWSRKLWHLSLVVSGEACWWQDTTTKNVYDKKSQRYAEDNRTVHLTARSDKSVACVTKNKRLYSTFCTVEANYWQTRSITRRPCGSRANCTDCRHTVKPLVLQTVLKYFFVIQCDVLCKLGFLLCLTISLYQICW